MANLSLRKACLHINTIAILLCSGFSHAGLISVETQCSHLAGDSSIQRCWAGNFPSNILGTYVPGDVFSRNLGGGDFVTNNSFSVDSSARANYGTLGISAFASVSNFFNTGADRLTRQALADSAAIWNDTFVVESNVLANGAPVTVQVTQVIDIAQVASQSSSGFPEVQVGGYMQFTSSFAPDTYCIATGWYSVAGFNACGGKRELVEGVNVITYESALQVGQQVTWSSILVAEAQVLIEGSLYNNGVGEGVVLLDAMHTAHTYFSVTDTSVRLVWESGNNYRQPPGGFNDIPEPTTIALSMFGLVGIAAVRRTRRRTLMRH
jgi:hypothetical protein